MAAAGGAPFFLSLHYTAPHWPWETRDDAALAAEVKDNLFHLHGGNIHTYRRMIHHMDEGIGWIMDALRSARRRRRHAGRLHQRQRRRALLRQLAAGRRQDGPDRRRHPRALDRALAGARSRAGGVSDAALHDDGLVGDDARRRRRRGRPGAIRSTACRCCRCCAMPAHAFARPLHWRMNHRGQRALRDGDWKYLRVDGHDYLFDLAADERERANRAPREPQRLAAMRADWEALERDHAADPGGCDGEPRLSAPRTCRSADRTRRDAVAAADPHDLQRFVDAQAQV